MADRELAGMLSQIRQSLAGGRGLDDAQLLERFTATGDEAAFELLVRRHERLLFGVCGRILPDFHDAEDAFQAAFLALARKAVSISRRQSLAGWLYKVSYRIAVTLRAKSAKEAARTRPLMVAADMPAPFEANVLAEWEDVRSVLDEELLRLPARFRTPTILCYLEGKTVDEAAAELGWPRGTVASRLARARRRLRERLTRRGLAVPGVTVIATLARAGRSMSASHALIGSTARSAGLFSASGAPATSAIPARVLALTQEVLRAMSIKKQTTVAIVVIAFAGFLLLGSGLGLKWLGGAAAESDPPPVLADAPKGSPPASEKPAKAKERPEVVRLAVSRPVKVEFTPFQDYTGRLEAAIALDVLARASGRLDNVNCRTGVAVKKGALLFEIDATIPKENLLKAEANLQMAETRRKRSDADLQRARKHLATGLMGKEDLDKANAAAEVEVAMIRLAQVDVERARRELQATKVTAPIDGTVGRLQVNPGGPVSAEKTVLTTVSVLDPMQVVFDMDEGNFLRYQRLLRQQKVKGEGSPLLMTLADGTGFPGTLASFDNQINHATGTIRVRGVVPNPGRQLLPGMSAHVRLSFGPPRPVLQVPTSAIIFGPVNRMVLVMKDEKLERRPVKLGQQDGRSFVIEEGLTVNDWVVTDGDANQSLPPGQRVEARPVELPRRGDPAKD